MYFSSKKKLITNNIRVHTVNISTSLNAKINVLKHLVLIFLLHFYNKNNKTTNMHVFFNKYKIFTYFRKQRISKFGQLKFVLFRNISSLGIRMCKSIHITKHNKVTRPAPLLLPKLMFGNTGRIFAKTEELL